MSSRLGKKLSPKRAASNVYVGTDGFRHCGHQHTSARAAKNCIENHKKRERIQSGNSNWYVKTYIQTGKVETGLVEIPS